MMKNHVQKGDTLTIPAPAAVLSGAVVVAGQIIGVANGDAASGSPVDVDVTGVFSLSKVAALAIDVGDLVYWDAAPKLVTKTAVSNKKLGYAVTAASNPSATVNVRLVPVV
ncbi:DUF2190 family protein [Asticcacaulis sp. SL142]|uniref:DUF2190 family protein n=1 Tax=Asticcacaulis sp. SL142 TaxID=2995155 RepID=UPI00226C7A95|nr:DUF2190 family protein [Asticcacaulis sp. SL142]WAC48844.1 DUF2190 family protein [Asticcacaulis sp. SL142]